MSLGMELDLSPRDFVLDGDAALPPKKGAGAPQFSAYLYCGQTAGSIKMPLGMEVGLRPGDFVLDGDAPPSKKGGGDPIFGPCLLWPNGWMDQDVTWHGGRPWSSTHGARWGNSSSPQKRGRAPKFSAHLYCGQTAGCIKMPLGMEVGLSPGDFVRWGPSPLFQKGRSPTQFSAHVYYGQTAAWIKMPLGMEVSLGVCEIVFDVDPVTPRKRAHPPHPIFGPCLLWPNGWMDEDAA